MLSRIACPTGGVLHANLSLRHSTDTEDFEVFKFVHGTPHRMEPNLPYIAVGTSARLGAPEGAL